jgi:hypothetical protein
MTKLEQAALGHASEWLRYQASPQARRDAEIDRKRRAASDKAAGHIPACSLTRCAAGCPKAEG